MPMGGAMPSAAPAAAAPEVSPGQGPVQNGFSLVPVLPMSRGQPARFLSLSLILVLHQPTHPANPCVLAVGSPAAS